MSTLTDQAQQKKRSNNGQMDDLLEEADEKKRLQCWLPAGLHQRLKMEAAQQGTSMTELAETALRRFLD